jgi:predicted methyltransferase
VKKFAISAVLLSLAISGAAYGADAVPAAVTAAVGHYIRPPKDQARDAARNPAQLLAFSGIKPGMKVVDLVPEDGYYTRILSKLVGPSGRVYSYVPIPGFPIIRFDLEKAGKQVPIDPILAIQNTRTEFANVTAVWEQLYFNGGSFGLPEQVDAVLLANNYHNLKIPGFAAPEKGANNAPGKPLDLVGMNKAIFRAMKPGGVYIIVDDSAEADSVKQDVMAAGFVLDGSSDILAGDKQFVLRFKKPANASAETKRPKDMKQGMENYFGNTRHSGISRDIQRWVHYHADGTFQEYGNTPAYEQIGTWFWDSDGMNCMLKEYPDVERGSVICHDYSAAVNKPVDTVIDEGPAAWKIEKGYTYPAAPKNPNLLQ